MLDGKCKIGLEVIELAPAVVAHTLELIRKHILVRKQCRDRVGQLDLSACPRRLVLKVMENARREDIAADDAKSGRRFLRIGFLDNAANAMRRFRLLLDAYDAVAL